MATSPTSCGWRFAWACPCCAASLTTDSGGSTHALAWALVGAGVGGWLWDGFAVRIGLWTYDPAHLSGIWFLGLPLEEWLWIGGITLFGGVTVVLKEAGVRNQEIERLGD
ncbi:MAG: lycopene cyclase domain-containing protein [Caldilineaceae bacterium]